MRKLIIILVALFNCGLANASNYKCIEGKTGRVFIVDMVSKVLFEEKLIQGTRKPIGIGPIAVTGNLGNTIHLQWNPQQNPILRQEDDMVEFFLNPLTSKSGMRRFHFLQPAGSDFFDSICKTENP